jgi:hypothetical protein
MKIHELKTWPQFMGPIIDGGKPFELRKDDRGFEPGDVLHLREWNPETEKYGPREALVEVTYIMLAFEIMGDLLDDYFEHPWVVMGVKLLTWNLV